MAISAVGEGCYKQMEALLPDIVNTVLPFLTDPHPRVRYAACNAVGQLSTDFQPGFQKKFHARVSIFALVDKNKTFFVLISSFFETCFKIKPSDKILQCFDLTEIIFKYTKKMNKTLHIRSKITRENMKSDKICTNR